MLKCRQFLWQGSCDRDKVLNVLAGALLPGNSSAIKHINFTDRLLCYCHVLIVVFLDVPQVLFLHLRVLGDGLSHAVITPISEDDVREALRRQEWCSKPGRR